MRVTTVRWTSAVACIAALLSIAAAALAPTTAHAQSGPFVFVPNANDNVARIDVPTGTLVPGTIGVGAGALSAAVRGDQSLVYVTNLNSNSVSVIETATNTVVATIAVGSRPFGVAVSPDGTRVYVTNEGSNSTSVIDTATNTVVATIPTGSFSEGSVSSDGTRPMSPTNSNNVSVIDTAPIRSHHVQCRRQSYITAVSPRRHPRVCGEFQCRHGIGRQHRHQRRGRNDSCVETRPVCSPSARRWAHLRGQPGKRHRFRHR